MLALILPLLWGVTLCQPSVVDTLQCINATDLYSTLYYICNRTVLCRELYHLEGGAYDFFKFSHQLSLIALFNSNASQSTASLIVTQIWPEDWLPYYLVPYNASAPSCNDTLAEWLADNTTRRGMAFVQAVTAMMMTYKEYISNEHQCNDHNERLRFDPTDDTFRCECRGGKVCNDSDANSNGLIVFMDVATILLLLLLIFISSYNALNYSKQV